jgi:hypothetical protein
MQSYPKRDEKTLAVLMVVAYGLSIRLMELASLQNAIVSTGRCTSLFGRTIISWQVRYRFRLSIKCLQWTLLPRCQTSQRPRPILITSRNQAPPSAHWVARGLDCDALRLGSAGAKTMAVITGTADIYVHDGGMYQWDSAAPAAVALAAGFHVSRIDGSNCVQRTRRMAPRPPCVPTRTR